MKNINNGLCSLIGIIVMVAAFSCKTTKLPVDNYIYEDALLWQIDGKKLAKTSYLYGTIHIIDTASFFWPKGTLEAFEAAEQMAFEVDLDDMYDLGKQMGLLTKAVMKDGISLRDLYTDEEYKIVSDHFQEKGLPMMIFEKMKPMFLTVLASDDMDLTQGLGGGSGMKSYEMEFYEMVKGTGKEVEGLETLEFQLSVFDSIPYEAQADMLLEAVTVGDDDDAFQQMIDMYTSQDINSMISAMSEEDQGIEGYEDVLLYQRNKNWIPVMEEKMSRASTFFAVGAGHLGGQGGVIDLLKKAGYKLTPLSHTNTAN